MTKRGVGCICKCGAPIWLWDTEMESEAELAELRQWKQEDAWTRTIMHSPHGCGERIVVYPGDLILLEKCRAETGPKHQQSAAVLSDLL